MPCEDDAGPGEFDLDDDVDDDPEHDQLSCPSCGQMVFDDTDRCPHCGDWVMPMAAAASSRSNWIWWTALVLVVVLIITWGVLG
jgi:hypothetical protein